MSATIASKPGRRYSREQQQEARSRAQFAERVGELGWIASSVDPDLGEDLLVRIYDGGQTTGLSFYVQLKSSADAERLKRKKSPALRYRLEVKDLEHWEKQTIIVVLVVWDVAKRVGWWRTVPEIIEELDKGGTGWRNKKTATVSVPVANASDMAGLQVLRWKVARHNLPLIPKPDTWHCVLSFSASEDGQGGADALRRALELGEPVALEGDLVPTIEWPEWHRRAFGAAYPRPIAIHVSPKPPDGSHSFRIEAQAPQGATASLYIELKYEKLGRKRFVLSNEHQKLPLAFTLEGVDDEAPHLHFHYRRPVNGVYEARDAAFFLLTAMSTGSVLRLIHVATGEQIVATQTGVGEPSERVLDQARRWYDLLSKLCFIQQRISVQGTLSIGGGMSEEDEVAAQQLFTILSTGMTRGSLSFVSKLRPGWTTPAWNSNQSGAKLSLEIGDSEPIRLLNLVVRLGRVRLVPVDKPAFLRLLHERRTEANRRGKPVQFEIRDMPIVREYIDLIPDDVRWENLCSLAATQDGYCTLSQARWMGYADELFLALVPSGKVEPVAADVYHLSHFPRSDHEELVVPWLQTDRQGIFSHDTALFLHELSDILPRRRHITVPPGWTSTQSFEPDVVLHHAEIAEPDTRWLGPVPYTGPVRTLRDCIDEGIASDLIEQAIDEGVHRGLFERADIPVPFRAESA